MSKRASLDKREKETPKVIKGVMSAFVSSSNDDKINKNDTKNETEKELNKSQEDEQKSDINSTDSVKESETVINTNSVKTNDTKVITINVKNNDTNNNTENVVSSITDNETNEVTNDVTKIVTNKTPKITHVKSIRIGNRTLESTYSTEESTTRCAYHLRKDTIDKIEVCSKLSGMKKAEFVDLVLNSVLTEILNKGSRK